MNNITQLSAKAREDYDLVQLAIAGNQSAYTALHDRYRTSVFHHMLKMVNNRDDAADLTMEAFSKAFRKLAALCIQHLAVSHCDQQRYRPHSQEEIAPAVYRRSYRTEQ